MTIFNFPEVFNPSAGNPDRSILNYAHTSIPTASNGARNVVVTTNTGTNSCSANAANMPDAIAYSSNAFFRMDDASWELVFTAGSWNESTLTFTPGGRIPAGRFYVGLCSADVALTSDVASLVNWSHCVYVSTETWSAAQPPHPPKSVYIYEKSSSPIAWLDGIWTDTAQKIILKQQGGTISYYLDNRMIYRSIVRVTYPLELTVALGCHNQAMRVEMIYGPNVGVGTGEIAPGGQQSIPEAAIWTFPAPSTLPQPTSNPPGPLQSRFQEVVTDWQNYSQRFADQTLVGNSALNKPIRIFEIEWEGLSAAEAAMLDAHYDSTSGGISFAMTDPHTGEFLTNCRYASYSRGPHVKYWSQTRQATVIKYVT